MDICSSRQPGCAGSTYACCGTTTCCPLASAPHRCSQPRGRGSRLCCCMPSRYAGHHTGCNPAPATSNPQHAALHHPKVTHWAFTHGCVHVTGATPANTMHARLPLSSLSCNHYTQYSKALGTHPHADTKGATISDRPGSTPPHQPHKLPHRMCPASLQIGFTLHGATTSPSRPPLQLSLAPHGSYCHQHPSGSSTCA